MKSLNDVTLLGLVVTEPKFNQKETGTKIISFRVKTQEEYTNRETKKTHEHNEFHDVKAFGFMAEKCEESVRNGVRVLVRGHNRHESWKDKVDRQHSRTVVLIDDVIVLDAPVSQENLPPQADA